VIDATTLAPDATKTLILASKQQNDIGWGHWTKGRWSQERATLQNYYITHKDAGKKYATSKKWAKEIALLTWDLIHHIWLERNNTEHDSAGCPKLRSKDKLIEIIQGESQKNGFQNIHRTGNNQREFGNIISRKFKNDTAKPQKCQSRQED
jgi:hypothetical protein